MPAHFSTWFRGAAVGAAMVGVGAANAAAQPEAPTPPEPPAVEAPAAPVPTDADGHGYPVSRITLSYRTDHPSLPPLDDGFLDVPVNLVRTPEGLIAPTANFRGEPIRLRDIGSDGPVVIYGSAVREISRAIANEFNRRKIIVVYVEPSPDDIDIEPPFEDLRDEDNTELRMLVRAGVVRRVGSIASGDRDIKGERVNHPSHRRIRENSPIQPADEDGAQRTDLIRQDALENYVYRLNRHPGRQVGVALSAATAGEPGDIVLDYLVSETKPWSIYAQVSNTGTESTDEWRQRFGFAHNQLTGADDILRLDFITAGFDSSNAVIASYERPLWDERLRGRLFGSWSEFTASDVGQGEEEFTGESWTGGAEVLWNVYQRRELFVDLLAGLRYQHVETTNEVLEASGEAGYVVPYIGARLERSTEASITEASIVIETSFGDADEDDVENLGRPEPDDDWTLLTWDLSHSFYLEPLLNPGAWQRRESWKGATLAHEIAGSVRGQYAFGNRLIPNAQDVLGGLFTVRGYPESIVAGDTVVMGSLEYRFHLPRALGIEEEPSGQLFGEPFRWRPQQPYGRPDWDLIFKAFVDAGRAINSDRLAFEKDETLVGAGVGAELQIKRFLSLRVDWGVALEDVNEGLDDEVKAGDSRVHFVATLVF